MTNPFTEDNDKAQALRERHCGETTRSHECVGTMLIDNSGICLACPLCGLDDRRGVKRRLEIHNTNASIRLIEKDLQ